ncbi:MAG: ParB/RepB/Spo0J family partition protein [Candidatus Dormibacteria bacterium]
MSKPRGGLGRGLGALIPGADAPAGRTHAGPQQVRVDSIRANPQQPRQGFDDADLRSLADSIRQHGVLQPLLVTQDPDGGYTLIAGERRLRAARLAGFGEVPVVVREQPHGEENLALALVENLQRHDLNALEEAEAYRQLLEDFSLTQEDVGHRVGRSRVHVSNSIRLLALAPALQGALLGGAISAGHGRALAGLDHERQEHALRMILRDDMNVRQTEDLARSLAEASIPGRTPRAPRHEDPNTRALEDRFRDALQARVSLRRTGHRGKLVVQFANDEELNDLYRRIVGDRPL